jgi:hypothetical protein
MGVWSQLAAQVFLVWLVPVTGLRSSDLRDGQAVLLAGDTSRQRAKRTDFAVTARLRMGRVSATVALRRSYFAGPC